MAAWQLLAWAAAIEVPPSLSLVHRLPLLSNTSLVHGQQGGPSLAEVLDILVHKQECVEGENTDKDADDALCVVGREVAREGRVNGKGGSMAEGIVIYILYGCLRKGTPVGRECPFCHSDMMQLGGLSVIQQSQYISWQNSLLK